MSTAKRLINLYAIAEATTTNSKDRTAFILRVLREFPKMYNI